MSSRSPLAESSKDSGTTRFGLKDCRMGKTTGPSQLGGGTTHVGDSYVWAEIYYLDSPTDYHEYLRNSVLKWSRAASVGFITLDNARLAPWRRVSIVLMAAARRTWTQLLGRRFQRPGLLAQPHKSNVTHLPSSRKGG